MFITAAMMLEMSGCWDCREMDTIGIVMGVGLDKAEAPDEIEMTAQVEASTEVKRIKVATGSDIGKAGKLQLIHV
jgi:spore germination protein KC